LGFTNGALAIDNFGKNIAGADRPSVFKSRLKASIEPRVKAIFLATVARSTESLQVADIVAAAAGEGNNVVDRQFLGLSTALTLMAIPLKNIFPNFFREADPWSFLGHGKQNLLICFSHDFSDVI
jgi:hypothetical protein